MSQGGNFIFEFGPVFIGIIFVIVFAGILFTVLKGISQWNNNNHSPKLNVNAKVIAKRTAVRGERENHRTYTKYYVTFEVESGDRIEFEIRENEFGFLIEGDIGELAFQGTRYLGFVRHEATTGYV